MHKDRRSELNVARRRLRMTWTSGEDPDVQSTLNRFFALDEQAMESHHADSFYRFPASYFSPVASLGVVSGSLLHGWTTSWLERVSSWQNATLPTITSLVEMKSR
jgi:hypothetical protein